jgi:hypothetical protein
LFDSDAAPSTGQTVQGSRQATHGLSYIEQLGLPTGEFGRLELLWTGSAEPDKGIDYLSLRLFPTDRDSSIDLNSTH